MDASKIISYILDRLSENSTWRGIISILTGAGVVLSPDNAAKIIAAGLALVGIINIFRKSTPPLTPPPPTP